jgi:hypothetical protein
MPKTKLTDILKNGEDFKIRKLNPNDLEVKKIFQAVRKEQKRIKELTKISLEDLHKIVITI